MTLEVVFEANQGIGADGIEEEHDGDGDRRGEDHEGNSLGDARAVKAEFGEERSNAGDDLNAADDDHVAKQFTVAILDGMNGNAFGGGDFISNTFLFWLMCHSTIGLTDIGDGVNKARRLC